MPRTIDKKDFLTGTTSYVKMGKDFYVMKKVNGITDPSEEAKEMYRQQYHNATKELKDIVSEGATSDWNKQLKKLQDEKSSKSIVIPPNRFDQAVMYLAEHKKLVELRTCVYHPVEILITKNWLRAQEIELPSRIMLPDGILNNTELVLTLKNDYYFPFLAGFDDRSKLVYTFGIQTFHTFSDSHLCIGNSRYEDYKALSDEHLSEQISRTNTFSPANQMIVFRNIELPWRVLITSSSMVSIARKDGAAWTTSTP
jgi:hypothetical protein